MEACCRLRHCKRFSKAEDSRVLAITSAWLLSLPTPEVWKTSLAASEPVWVWHKLILWRRDVPPTAAVRPSSLWQWEQQCLFSKVLPYAWCPHCLFLPFSVVGPSPEIAKFRFFYIAEEPALVQYHIFLMPSKRLVKKSLLQQNAYVFNPKDRLAPMQGKPPGAKAR